jgi:Homing endonuclease associated repeat
LAIGWFEPALKRLWFTNALAAYLNQELWSSSHLKGWRFLFTRKNVNREQIISALQECAAALGHAPSHSEFQANSGVSLRTVKKIFPTYTQALTDAGLERHGGGHTLTMHALFRDWATVVRKIGKIPTLAEYGIYAKYSITPFISRFVTWTQVPRGLHIFAEQEGLEAEWADVMAIIREDYDRANEWVQPSPGKTPSKAHTGEAMGPAMVPTKRQIMAPAITPTMRRPILVDRPVYGVPLTRTALAFTPLNEMGVVCLFGAMAMDLGFMVTRIQREFPDCEALRQMDDERCQLVLIEFELESRNFLQHRHDPEKCDLIVCWKHNWPECPIEVLELRKLFEERH